MVIATRVFCSSSNIQLYSACSAKHVHVYSNGSVFANDDSQTPRKYALFLFLDLGLEKLDNYCSANIGTYEKIDKNK